MPIYEFKCESCHEITEVVQSISAPPLTDCPKCNGPVKKLISHSSFQLKGGGWYADGYSHPEKKEPTEKKAPQQNCSKAKDGTCPCAKKTTT